MISLHHTLLPWINKNIPAPPLKDSGLNGLQIFSQDAVHKIGFAVSTNARTVETAQELSIDTLVVHHGLFWTGTATPLTGLLGNRVRLHYQNKINLIGLHLPLDIHPVWGNNVQIGQKMEWDCEPADRHGLVYHTLSSEDPVTIIHKLSHVFQRPVQVTHEHFLKTKIAHAQPIHIGWCSGSGGDLCWDYNFDVFISGEFCERHYDLALESGTTLISGGHYATERFGILALQNAMSAALHHGNIECFFLEQWSPW
jgi:putative NIF3 family GTP cyclohydrolase 1 type 2